MKRRTLDILFSIGGVGLAALLLIIGVVMSGNADFSNRYVTEQLVQQRITFKTAETLTDEERKADCLVKYAGQALTTGKQAECYANEFIGLHVKTSAGGKTYAEMGDVQTALRAQIASAQNAAAQNAAAQNAASESAGDPAVDDLQKQLATATTQRETVFKGETLRGVLLTSYGFSVLGDKAAQAASVIYLGALLLVALSIAGFVHGVFTPKNEAFATPDAGEMTRPRETVSV